MISWLRRLFAPRLPGFRPGMYYNEELRLTDIILRDTAVVWVPGGLFEGHAIDLGYDFDGDLVGIQVWGDVRRRPER